MPRRPLPPWAKILKLIFFYFLNQRSFPRIPLLPQEKQSPYEVIPSSVTVSGSRVSMELRNTKNNVVFDLSIDAYATNTARVRMNEKSPLHPR
jgi:hypothetical protein